MNSDATVLRNRLVSRARIRHLQLFVRVAELGTVKRAAESVALTQPAVSQALADLEALLECALFLRHSRGMLPTAVGQALLPVARRILLAVDDGAGQLAALAGDATGVVRVGAITAALAGLLVRAVPEFGRRHPGIVLHLHEADALQQAALVERREIDVSLCRAPSVTPQGWRFVPLLADRFAVVAGPAHPLAGRRRVGMAQLGEATWLNTPAGTAAREAFDRLFAGATTPPRMSPVITRSAAMLWAMLAQEPLLAVLPASFARQLVDAGALVELALDRELPFEPIGMLLTEPEIGPAAQTFAGFLEAFSRAELAAARRTKRVAPQARSRRPSRGSRAPRRRAPTGREGCGRSRSA